MSCSFDGDEVYPVSHVNLMNGIILQGLTLRVLRESFQADGLLLKLVAPVGHLSTIQRKGQPVIFVPDFYPEP